MCLNSAPMSRFFQNAIKQNSNQLYIIETTFFLFYAKQT